MEPTTIEGSDITVERSLYGMGLVRIHQGKDLVVVYDEDAEAFIAAIRKHARKVEEPEPAPENATNAEEMRMKRIVARVRIHQLRRDAAYEEGKIAVIDSILEAI